MKILTVSYVNGIIRLLPVNVKVWLKVYRKEISTIVFSKKKMLHFKTESTKIPKVRFIQSFRSGYWLSFPRRFQGFTRGSLLRNFFFGISLREKGRERLEGFSFRATTQSLMASLITYRAQIQRLNPKCHIVWINMVFRESVRLTELTLKRSNTLHHIWIITQQGSDSVIEKVDLAAHSDSPSLRPTGLALSSLKWGFGI